MTWASYLLSDDDDLELSKNGACQTNGVAIVTWSGAGYKTPHDVANQLAASDTTGLQLRIKNGRPVETYNGAAWVDTNPLMVGGTTNKNDGCFKCRDINISRIEGGGQQFRVEYTCTAYGPIANDAGYPITDPPIKVITAARTRNVAIFRTGAHSGTTFIPTDSLVSGSTTKFDQSIWHTGNDISSPTVGNRPPFMVDVDGQGIPGKIDQTIMEISWVEPLLNYSWNAGTNEDDTSDGGRFEPYWLSKYWVGSRNSEAFLGFPIGSLLCENVSIQPVEEYDYGRVTVTLVYDEWHHAFQRPLTVAGVVPKYQNGTTAVWHAREVLWFQPYLEAAPFATGSVTVGSDTFTLLPQRVLTYITDLFGDGS